MPLSRKIQIGRMRITVSSTAPATSRVGARPMSGAVTMPHSCRPISAKTAPSSTYCSAFQVARMVSRTSGCRSIGERKPSTRPVTTTASTPEASASSPSW